MIRSLNDRGVFPDGLIRGRLTVLHLGSPNGMFGAERWILALAKHSSKERVHSIVGVIDDTGRSREPELITCAKDLGLDTLIIKAPGRFNMSAVRSLRHEVQQRNVSVLNSHFYKATVISVLAARSTSCKVAATPHGWSVNAGAMLQLYEWIERIAFGFTDAIAPLSPDLTAGLARLPWTRSRLRPIENGVDLSELDESMQIADDLRLAKDSGATAVGYIGQLIERKRVDTLIRAFARMSRSDAVLFIIGDGPLKPTLESLAKELGIADRVRFTGFRDDRLTYLRGLDVLVLPSSLEGIPRSLMEGMAAGVPVIATRIPGVVELIADRQTGWLFEVGDEASLSGLLDRAVDDRASIQSTASAARALVRTRFSAQRMADEYEQLYSSLVLGRSPRSVAVN